jgi:hypothetical protein
MPLDQGNPVPGVDAVNRVIRGMTELSASERRYQAVLAGMLCPLLRADATETVG